MNNLGKGALILALGGFLWSVPASAVDFNDTPGSPLDGCPTILRVSVNESSADGSAQTVNCRLRLGAIALVEQAGQTAERGGFSDAIIFSANAANANFTDIIMDSTDGLPRLPANFACGTCLLEPAGAENSTETVIYTAINGANATRVIYTITSDTPEPSSLVLLGTGLVGLVTVARRRLHLS